jgi:hypothetical protein
VAADPGYAPERSIASAYLRPLTLADVLDGMFELFTANWRVYVVALGALLIPMNFAVSYLTSEVYGGAGLLDQLSNPAAAEAFFAGGPSLAPFIGLIAVSVVSFVLVTPFVNGVACRIAADGYEHRQPAIGEVLRATLRRYAALVGVTLLLALFVLAVMALPALLVFGAVTTESPQLGVAAAALGAAGVGVIFFVLVRLSLAYAVVVVERVGPVSALQRSFRLVRGRFWRTLFTLALAGIIAGFVAQIVSLPFSVPGSLFGDWAGVVFSAAGGVIVAVLTTPLAANAQTLLYFDGRVRVEGYDLDVLSRELTAAAGPPLG